MVEGGTAICLSDIMETARHTSLSENASDRISCKAVLLFSITRPLKKHECLYSIELQERPHRRKKRLSRMSICLQNDALSVSHCTVFCGPMSQKQEHLTIFQLSLYFWKYMELVSFQLLQTSNFSVDEEVNSIRNRYSFLSSSPSNVTYLRDHLSEVLRNCNQIIDEE